MKNRISLMVLTAAFSSLVMVGLFTVQAIAASDVPRMTKEELKEMLDNSNLIILDMRAGKDWKSSEFLIKGAVRENPNDFDSWAMKYPKDKTLVLYCA